MPRGGKREKAGRKTTWDSKVRFEDTSLLRVPTYIKDKVLELAHRLDAGEVFDSVSNSDQQKLDELETQILALKSELEKSCFQLEEIKLELETKSNTLQTKIDLLQQENTLLLEMLNPENLQCDLVTNSKVSDKELATKSKDFEQMELLSVNINTEVQQLKPLTAAELSRRLGKGNGFVKSRKNYYKERIEEFYSVLKDSDPEKIKWVYSDKDKKYHPIIEPKS